MPVKKSIHDFDMMNLDELVQIVKDMAVDNQYKVERAKSPASKRHAKTNIRFWGSMGYYLQLVEAMTDDEVLQLEDRIKAKKGAENGG